MILKGRFKSMVLGSALLLLAKPAWAQGQPQVPAQPAQPLPLTMPGPKTPLDQLYVPPPLGGAPYSASTADPTLSDQDIERARSVDVNPVLTSELLPIGRNKLPPIQLEASFNEVVSLREALNYALANNLTIRISNAAYDAQRYLFYSSLGNFLPDFNLNYRAQRLDNRNSPPSNIYTNSVTMRYPVFQGGGVFFGMLASLNRAKAAKSGYKASINDTLFEVYRLYNELLLNHALLQIRVKSVELSRAQLRLNEQLKMAGVGTNFAIYQSRTLLAQDKQALLQQEVNVRQSALLLALRLNTSVAINLFPIDSRITEERLVDDKAPMNFLISAALNNRPELKQFEYLRLAAVRNIQVQAAPLYPSLQFFTSHTKTRTHGGGGGAAASLSGSTVVIPTGSGGGGIGVSGRGGTSLSAGLDLTWNLTGVGVPDAFNTLAARAQARQAALAANEQLITVTQQVRSSYLNMLTAQSQVDVAAETVASATEQLRLANLRLRYGQGINLELIQAQRDYINSLTTQAQAIVAYNVSQAQLLRDTGLITVNTLTNTSGPPVGASTRP